MKLPQGCLIPGAVSLLALAGLISLVVNALLSVPESSTTSVESTSSQTLVRPGVIQKSVTGKRSPHLVRSARAAENPPAPASEGTEVLPDQPAESSGRSPLNAAPGLTKAHFDPGTGITFFQFDMFPQPAERASDPEVAQQVRPQPDAHETSTAPEPAALEADAMKPQRLTSSESFGGKQLGRAESPELPILTGPAATATRSRSTNPNIVQQVLDDLAENGIKTVEARWLGESGGGRSAATAPRKPMTVRNLSPSEPARASRERGSGPTHQVIKNEFSGSPSQDNTESPGRALGQPATAPANHSRQRQASSITQQPARTQEPQQAGTPVRNAIAQSGRRVSWPLPETLMTDLAQLEQISVTTEWATAAKGSLLQLNSFDFADPYSLNLIAHLKQLAQQLNAYAHSLAQSDNNHLDVSSELSRIAYRMEKRTDVWLQVHQLAQSSGSNGSVDTQNFLQAVSYRKQVLEAELVPEEWLEYLCLDRTEQVFGDDKATAANRRYAARKVLRRINSKSLSDEQRLFVEQAIGPELYDSLLKAATTDLDLDGFVQALEEFESTGSSLAEFRFNEHFQNFFWNPRPDIQALATVVNAHYRNANFRISVSDELINMMLPGDMEFEQPVSERILGAPVRGQSRISNRLQVRLIPDPERLSFRLNSLGTVFSRTRAQRSGFVFHYLGNARINASKGVAIGMDGVLTQPATASASADQRLVDINSGFDGVPLLGRVARAIARQQQHSKQPEARREVETRAESEFQDRVDQEIQQRVANGQYWLDTKVFSRLHALELDPTPLEMRTTDDEVVIRYRVAGPDQMGASTARPQAQPESLLSMQMHQTAVNNVLDRIDINGRDFTGTEFLAHVSELLDQPVPDTGQAPEISFKFAPQNGIKVEFEDDKVNIVLRLSKFRIGNSKIWRNLTVKAGYFLQAQGTHMELLLDEEQGVTLTGYRLNLRDQLAVRTAFNTLFQTHYEFELLPPEFSERLGRGAVAVSQLIVTEGWLCVSVDRYRPNRVSGAAERPAARTSYLKRTWR